MLGSSRVVVVGAGLGGLRTVQRLRARGFTGQLILIGAEPHHPYDRPPLTKQVLRGEADATCLIEPAELQSLDVGVQLATTAVGLDPAAHQLQTDRGALDYDSVVLATGARPRRLPALDGQVLRSLDDALALRQELGPGRSLVVIGAGMIGCEVAAGARSRGVDVDLVDVLPGPAVRVLGPVMAERLASIHRDRGVRLHLGHGVRQTQSGKVILDDGTALAADVVLQAIGVRPDTDWLGDSGLAIDDGIVCDSSGRAVEDVWAVGDVARWHDPALGTDARIEHRAHADAQGAAVARAVLDPDARSPLAAVPSVSSEQYDITVQTYGDLSGNDEAVVVDGDITHAPFLIAYRRDDRVSGVLGVGALPELLDGWQRLVADHAPWSIAVRGLAAH